jgi:probable F420-dependent oxidoreductase
VPKRPPEITFALQAAPRDAVTWANLAKQAEKAGFEALLVADHPGMVASPFVALAAAAAVTTKIGLGTYVLNTGVRDPVQIASDVATLDVLSRGRAQLGIGAGHTPAEWTMSGAPYPSPRERVTRLIESALVIRGLLTGDAVTSVGERIVAEDAQLVEPRPLQRRVPMLIGGGNQRLLHFAGEHADIVGVAGLGRTLADGHQHEARWSDDAVDASIAIIRSGASTRERPPRIDALVQYAEITNNRDGAAIELARRVPGLDPADALGAPYALIGSEAEIVQDLREYHERWGISRYTVRLDAMELGTRLIKWLKR